MWRAYTLPSMRNLERVIYAIKCNFFRNVQVLGAHGRARRRRGQLHPVVHGPRTTTRPLPACSPTQVCTGNDTITNNKHYTPPFLSSTLPVTKDEPTKREQLHRYRFFFIIPFYLLMFCEKQSQKL